MKVQVRSESCYTRTRGRDFGGLDLSRKAYRNIRQDGSKIEKQRNTNGKGEMESSFFKGSNMGSGKGHAREVSILIPKPR